MSSTYVTRVAPFAWKLCGKEGPLLSELDVELTERCNNDCIHCYINLPANDPAKGRELTTEKVKDILEQAASLGCMKVRYTGGEPLLRQDFAELYLHTRKLGMTVLLFTNATRLTARLADLFARVPPREKIEVSLYGMRRESYEAVTQTPGSFDAAWRGIHLLQQRDIPFVVKSALLPPNGKEREEFQRWAATLPWMEGSPSYSMSYDLRARRDGKKNARIQSLRLAPEETLEILSSDRDGYFKSMQEFCSRFIGVTGDALFTCGAGKGSGSVDAYGRFQLCLLLRHPLTVFDLAKGSLKNALTEFSPQLRQLRASDPEYLRRCARCFLKGLCEQCPAKSWMEHGTLDTPSEYHCQVAHAQAQSLGLISEGEVAWEVGDWRERLQAFSERGASSETSRSAQNRFKRSI